MRPSAVSALGLLISSTLVAACAGTAAPGAPSASASRAGAASSVTQNLHSDFASPTAVDLALCLAGQRTTGCFSAAHTFIRTSLAAATAPTAPINLSTIAVGSSVTLTWSAPVSGDPVTTYVIEAGSGPGLANLANFITNSTATTFSASGIGAGTYYVRVRAQNGGGTGPASNESILAVGASGCTTPPNAPTSLAATVAGSTVTLIWSAPSGGCPPTSYLLQAGSSSGLSNLANANVGNTVSYGASGVSVGTYYVRVIAANAYGQSAASNEVVVTVAGGFGAGTWSYALSVSVPLNATPIMSCVAQSSGTTIVSSSGTFSIPFSVACYACAESGTITGTIAPTGVSGSVTASISGPISGPGGCSNQQPTPSPAAMAGTCNSAGCTASTGSNLDPNLSFAVSYTLTPP
jgi:hypothetical protein